MVLGGAAAHGGRSPWYKGLMRRVLPWGRLVLALVPVLGCSFDAAGIAESSAAGPGGSSSGGGVTGEPEPGTSGMGPATGVPVTEGGATGEESSTGAVEPVTTGGPDTGAPMTTDLSTTGEPPDPSTTGPEDTGEPPDDSTTTGMPACPMPYSQTVLAKDATLVPPMVLGMSNAEQALVAFSPTAEMGIANFAIELPCEAQVAVWARVQDLRDGINMSNDPDSLYPHVDNQPEQGWLYGCQTEGLSDGYHWLRVRMGTPGAPCNTFQDLTPQLAAGAHTISFRNREPQYGSAAAAISRVLVTSDLGFVPN